MEKTTIKIDAFSIIGIAIETTNKSGHLGLLWQQFMTQGIAQKIPNKLSEEIYAIYTDYETNYQGKYTAIIGYPVENLDNIPNGLIGRTFANGVYQNFTAKGAMPMAVQQTWQYIWSNDDHLKRAYIADFEVYGTKAQNGANSEVEVFVGV